MDIKKMNTRELIAFLELKDVSKEICDSIEENEIDGSSILYMINDIEEFKAVLPKSGHRCKVKQVLAMLEEESSKPNQLCSPSGENKGEEVPIELLNDKIELTVAKPLSPATSCSSGSADVNEDAVITPSDNKVPVTPVSGKSALSEPSGSTSSRKRKENGSPLPDPLPFPTNFSVRVEQEIEKGSVLPVRKQLVADVGLFYFAITSHPRQGDYKRMALLMCKKFPELRDSNPSTYWLSLQKQLSQHFRNARRKSTATKPKSGESKTDESNLNNCSKRAKLFEDDPETQMRNLILLRDAKPGTFSQKTYCQLVQDTYPRRREIVEKAMSSSEILVMCPYLGKQEFVRKEMDRMMEDDLGKAEGKIANAFKALLKLNHEHQLSNEDVLKAIETVEKRLGKKKAISVVRFKDPSTKVDAVFQDQILHFRILCIGCPSDIRQTFITGESRSFFECADQDLIRALVDLLSAYYVFDMSYPKGMLGVMSFLQEICLDSVENVYQGTKYTALITEVKQKC